MSFESIPLGGMDASSTFAMNLPHAPREAARAVHRDDMRRQINAIFQQVESELKREVENTFADYASGHKTRTENLEARLQVSRKKREEQAGQAAELRAAIHQNTQELERLRKEADDSSGGCVIL